MSALTEYEEVSHRFELIKADLETERQKIMAPVASELVALEAEYEPTLKAAEAKLAKLREEVNAEVVAAGHTLKGETLQACYVKGRVSWDTKALDGYSAAHPEIAQFKTVGAPSVSIRAIK